MKTVGQRIREIRIEKGMSQVDVADKLSVSKVAISRYEHDKRRISAEGIRAIAHALDSTTETLLAGTPYEGIPDRAMALILIQGKRSWPEPAPARKPAKTASEARATRLLDAFEPCDAGTQRRIIAIAESFSRLSTAGQKHIMGYAQLLAESPRYATAPIGDADEEPDDG